MCQTLKPVDPEFWTYYRCIASIVHRGDASDVEIPCSERTKKKVSLEFLSILATYFGRDFDMENPTLAV